MARTFDAFRARLERQANEMACTCTPYRGGTTGAYHWDTCPWAGWQDGFSAAAELCGFTLPDLPITFQPNPAP